MIGLVAVAPVAEIGAPLQGAVIAWSKFLSWKEMVSLLWARCVMLINLSWIFSNLINVWYWRRELRHQIERSHRLNSLTCIDLHSLYSKPRVILLSIFISTLLLLFIYCCVQLMLIIYLWQTIYSDIYSLFFVCLNISVQGRNSLHQ